MKKILLAISLFALSAQAFSLDTDLSKKALNKLMNKNPVAKTAEGQPERVNTLIAHMMTSSFDENGLGFLSIVDNTCEREDRYVVCKLNISSSEKLKNAEGDFIETEYSTNSILTINYKFTESLFFLVGQVTFEYK